MAAAAGPAEKGRSSGNFGGGLRLDPDEIRVVPGEKGFQFKPIIVELIRTRYPILGSIFLVEGLETIPVGKSKRRRVVSLLLGDGEVCIHAVLKGDLHPFVDLKHIGVGAYVKLDQFELRLQEFDRNQDEDKDADEGNLGPVRSQVKDSKGKGKARDDEVEKKRGDRIERSRVVWIVVNDICTVGWNDSVRKAWSQDLEEEEQQLDFEDDLDVEEMAREYDDQQIDRAQDATAPMDIDDPSGVHIDPTQGLHQDILENDHHRARDAAKQAWVEDADDEAEAVIEDSFDAFETKMFPGPNHSSAGAAPLIKKPSSTAATKPPEASKRARDANGIALPRDWHSSWEPLKLTTLAQLPHLPYIQNWSCNILCVVSALSPVEPSRFPPHKQRNARLTDPSTQKHVHLTVFLDPEEFQPEVGRVVLLVGVKNHRFDGGSLKKYESDGLPPAGRWWWTGDALRQMKWLDWEGVEAWWERAKMYQAIPDL